MFELTKDELSRCHFGILKAKRGQNIKFLPFAFTELGVAMLSSVLKSTSAIKVNREIMRAFVTFRHLTSLPNNTDRLSKIEYELEKIRKDMNESLADQNDINEDTRAQLDAISIALAELQAKPQKQERKPIGYIQPEKD